MTEISRIKYYISEGTDLVEGRFTAVAIRGSLRGPLLAIEPFGCLEFTKDTA